MAHEKAALRVELPTAQGAFEGESNLRFRDARVLKLEQYILTLLC